MSASDRPEDTTIALTAAGVTVLIDVSEAGLPVIAYWGPELPGLDAEQAAAIIAASAMVAGTNNLEPHPRVAVLPEHRTGWTGRPGLVPRVRRRLRDGRRRRGPGSHRSRRRPRPGGRRRRRRTARATAGPRAAVQRPAASPRGGAEPGSGAVPAGRPGPVAAGAG